MLRVCTVACGAPAAAWNPESRAAAWLPRLRLILAWPPRLRLLLAADCGNVPEAWDPRSFRGSFGHNTNIFLYKGPGGATARGCLACCEQHGACMNDTPAVRAVALQPHVYGAHQASC